MRLRILILTFILVHALSLKAQKKINNEQFFKRRPMIVQRERPVEWKNLVLGGQFMDRFEPMPIQGKLTSKTWGGDNVKPRYTDNGIEDNKWSYWGGNSLLGKDNQYHMIVCRWLESSPKGHAYFPWSDVVHAVSKKPFGPYKVTKTLFPGHNPSLMQLKDGRYFIISRRKFWVETQQAGKSALPELKGLSKYWEEIPMEMKSRERVSREQSPMTFTQREDGSFLMLTRHGDIWLSKTGTSPYHRYTEERVYPEIEGRFEDPVIWRTNIQYHLITNDWQGRIAYHMRSKDGINWKLDDGVAYEPGIGKTADGTINKWEKYEVIRISQDKHRRATRVNFAVIDSKKAEDLENDNHSSKVLFFPLTPGKLITVLNSETITSETNEIRVKIKAEEKFNPLTDINLNTLKFGVSEEVNFGRGCKLIKTEKSNKDLILIFDAKGNKFTDNHFAGKLLGQMKNGKMLFAYSRLPNVNYLEPALSALPAKFTPFDEGVKIEVEVQNYGQVASKETPLKVIIREGVSNLYIVNGIIPVLHPFEKTTVKMKRMANTAKFKSGTSYNVTVQLQNPGRAPERIMRPTVIIPK